MMNNAIGILNENLFQKSTLAPIQLRPSSADRPFSSGNDPILFLFFFAPPPIWEPQWNRNSEYQGKNSMEMSAWNRDSINWDIKSRMAVWINVNRHTNLVKPSKSQ